MAGAFSDIYIKLTYVNEYLKIAWQVKCETERMWGVLNMLGVSFGIGMLV